MQEDMRLTLDIDFERAGREPEPALPRRLTGREDGRQVMAFTNALAERLDRVEALQARAAYPTYPGGKSTHREPAIVREVGRILAGPGQPRHARDAVVRTAVMDLQRALGLLPDGLVGDRTLCALAELNAGLGTPVVDGMKTR